MTCLPPGEDHSEMSRNVNNCTDLYRFKNHLLVFLMSLPSITEGGFLFWFFKIYLLGPGAMAPW